MEDVKVTRKLVTPAMAKTWLMKNTSNRPLSDKLVEYYASQMKKGNWRVSTDAIGFNLKGNLINGQHRLQAVVVVNTPQEFLIGENYPEGTFDVIDTGKSRSPGDILGAHGFKYAHGIAAITRAVMNYGRAGFFVSSKTGRTDDKLSNIEVLKYAEKHANRLEECNQVALDVRKKFKGLKAQQIGALYWVFSALNKPMAEKFFNDLGEGVGLSATSPIRVLRERLIADALASKKYAERDRYAWVILAWNHFRKGGSIKKLQWQSGDKMPKPL